MDTEQVRVEDADLTAVLVRVEEKTVLVVSVYVEGKDEGELDKTVRLIRELIRSTARSTGTKVEVILAGDFNRHDQLWGGDGV
jgi:exonuclease III